MASDYSDLPSFLASREGEAYQAQFSTSDYGRVGDQRPYQIVYPSYPAPMWLARFVNLKDALRECGTLCQLSGKPFRLVKWGSRLPCYPCASRKRTNMLPGIHIYSPGAMQGYPRAQPVADFHPRGNTIIYGPDGQPKLVGAPNFIVSRTPNPPTMFVDPQPLPVRYEEAVKTAQYLANTEGRNMYLCSSLGASCKEGAKNKKWVPVVYVQPGGLVKRYPQDMQMPAGVNSTNGSEVLVNRVTEDEFRELIRESDGATRMAQGA